MGVRFLMGLDVGGSKGRALLIDLAGGKAVSSFRAWRHPTVPETGGFGLDLDTDLVWRLLGEAAREALARAGATGRDVVAVAATGMRHGQVLVDREGATLLASPSCDARAAVEGLALASERGREFYDRTGHWPGPPFVAARLIWMAENAPERLARAHALLGLSEWLLYRMTGRAVAEPSVASETLLFDLGERRWADDLIRSLNLSRALFPEVAPAGTVLAPLSPQAAEHLGLMAGTPAVVGGGDTQCGLLGAGAAAAGQLGIIAGTTLVAQRVVDRPLVDPKARLWTSHHVIPGRWVLESNGGPGGEALDGMARLLYPGLPDPVAALCAEAAGAPAGADGIVSTLGAEVFNGSQLALPLGHLTVSPMMLADDPSRRACVAQAILEGIAYGMRANLDQIGEVAPDWPATLRLGGGMSRSARFAQLLADLTGTPVESAGTPEASALGAAVCAGVGAGVYADADAGAAALGRTAVTYQPNPAHNDAYQPLYQSWLEVRQMRRDADLLASGMAVQALIRASSRRTREQAAAKPAARTALRPRILCTAALDRAALEDLRKLGEVRYESYREQLRLLCGEDLVAALRGVDVLITEVDPVDAEVLAASPELRVVASCRGDAVNLDIAACSAHGIPVLTTPGRNADAVAELAVGFVLMLARKLPAATQFLRDPNGEAGDMGRMGRAHEQLQGQELWKKAVGLIGLGAVGRAVARRLQPFGVRILAFDPHLRPEAAALAGAELVALERLLAESDFVSLHAAVTDESRALLGVAELARMKPGAFLINTARAALVDEAALAAALSSGRLGGAALDVFSVEPPGPDHPLLALPNVIATPHVAGNTVEVAAHQGAMVCADLARLLAGQRPQHLANPEVLADWRLDAPRRMPSADVLARLKQSSRPRVTDLDSPEPEPASPAKRPGLLARVKGALAGRKNEPTPPPAPTNGHAAPDGRARAEMSQLLERFLQRVSADPELLAFSSGRQVTVRYDLPDVSLAFYTGFQNGAIECGLGEPPQKPQVQLKMRATVLDQIFTGRLGGTKAAMSGKLSFSGDTIKAMSLQRIQKDLNRLYCECRMQFADLDALLHGTAPVASAPAAVAIQADDERSQLVRTVEQLYARGLITSTGGNASVRVAGSSDAWITPNHAPKGALSPEMLVRIDRDGNPVGDSPYAPSSERMIHSAIFRLRPDVGAVIHTHAPRATILALAELPFLPISTEAAFIGELPRVPFLMPGSPDFAEAVAHALEKRPAALLQNHGLIVAGADLRRTADLTLIIEDTCDKLLACHALGRTPPVLPPELVATLQSLEEMIA
jgi:autoinducer 2 (AI-2) kinase